MTRKRFIKLLMGAGATRNEAEKWAREKQPQQPYSEGLNGAMIVVRMNAVGVSMREAARAYNRLAKEVGRFMISLDEWRKVNVTKVLADAGVEREQGD